MISKCFVCGSSNFSQKSLPISRIPGLAATWSLSLHEEILYNIREGYSCDNCYSSMRIQGLAACLASLTGTSNVDEFVDYCNSNKLKVAEINSCANLHDKLSKIKNLKFSEYYDQSEQISKNRIFEGINHEDIMNLSYSDESFDLVLHSETLEHINDPAKAINECLRVLKVGGICIFTIPIIWNRVSRSRLNAKGELTKPFSYHGDSDSEYPVIFEFGNDIDDVLKQQQVKCLAFEPRAQSYVFAIIKGSASNNTFNIDSLEGLNPKVKAELSKKESASLNNKDNKKLIDNFLNNGLVNDGERMIPEFHGENLFYTEHLQRYEKTKSLVENKVVLDIASGSGYGTQMIAQSAKFVFGVDVSDDAVRYARSNYQSDNISFITGSGTNIPLEDNSVDIVTTFETIEHIEDYELFVQEIKRVLKPDGLAIISTPNDLEYGEGNHFHVHEFKHKELSHLLLKYFKFSKDYFQSTWRSVLIGEMHNHESDTIENLSLMNSSPIKGVDKTLYFYMLCSNRKIVESINPSIGIGPHLSEASEWKHRKAELKYIEELKYISAEYENLKIEHAKLQKAEFKKSELISSILNSRKYKLILISSKINKVLRNPKMFINKAKSMIKK